MLVKLEEKQVSVGGLSFSHSTVEETILVSRIVKKFARRDAIYEITPAIVRRLDICTLEEFQKIESVAGSTRFPLVDEPRYNNPEDLHVSLVFDRDKEYSSALQTRDAAATQVYLVVRDKPMKTFVGLWLGEVRDNSLPKVSDYVSQEGNGNDILLDFGKIVLDVYYKDLIEIQVEK